MARSSCMRPSHAMTGIALAFLAALFALFMTGQVAYAETDSADDGATALLNDDSTQTPIEEVEEEPEPEPVKTAEEVQADQVKAAKAAKTEKQMDAVAAMGKLDDGSYADGLVDGGSYLIKVSNTDDKVVASASVPKKKGSKKTTTKAATATSDMSKEQRWKVVRDSKGFVSFLNSKSGQALTITGKVKSGATVAFAKYSKTKRAQKWAIILDGSNWRAMSALGKRLELVIAKASTKEGADVRVEASAKAKARRFDFMRIDTNYADKQAKLPDVDSKSWYELRSGKKALSIESASNGANASFKKVDGSLGQLFALDFVKSSGPTGYYRVISALSGKALEVANGNLIKGTNVGVGKASSARAQLWTVTTKKNGSTVLTSVANGYQLAFSGSKANANVRAKGAALKILKRENVLTEGTYALKAAKDASKALDVAKASTKAGAASQLWKYASNFNQKWYIAPVKDEVNTYTIESVKSGLLLTAASASKGAAITQRAASDSKLQHWTPSILSTGAVVFSNEANPALSLGYEKGKTKNGTKAVLGTGTDVSQRFRALEVDAFEQDAYFIHLAADPKLVVDVKKSSTKNRGNINFYSKNATGHQGNQKWMIRKNDNGTWRITNSLSCKALDVKKGKARDKNNVQQWEKNNNKSQQWNIEYVPGTGSFRIVSAINSNFVLEAGSSKLSANARIGKVDGTALQCFTFEKTQLYTGLQQRMFDRAQGLSSKTKYLILVWYDSCQVGIFEGSKGNWDYVKYVQCGPGADSTPTMRGKFEVGHKKPCLPDTPVARYATQIFLDMYFHSVLFSASEVGHHVSHGCVRMVWGDAKWIYDYVPSGTKIVID